MSFMQPITQSKITKGIFNIQKFIFLWAQIKFQFNHKEKVFASEIGISSKKMLPITAPEFISPLSPYAHGIQVKLHFRKQKYIDFIFSCPD